MTCVYWEPKSKMSKRLWTDGVEETDMNRAAEDVGRGYRSQR
jgi:hypothetical protein